MLETTQTPARERKAVRSRVNQMTRAQADVHCALDGLTITEQLIVLNEVIEEALGKPHKAVYVTARPARV